MSEFHDIPVAIAVRIAPDAVDLKELCSAFIGIKHKTRELELRIEHYARLRSWHKTQICLLTFGYIMIVIISFSTLF